MLRILLFLAGLNGLSSALAPIPPVDTRYALLIAIGKYPPGSEAEPLHARNDQVLFSQTLRQQGFPPSHLRLLSDQQATRQTIEQVFDSLARALPPGSRLVIHFSGHGLQLPDDNGDETDGLDEAILPYDGQANHPGSLIRDDELGRWLTRLRARIGPAGHLLFLFDSCHSGSILRRDEATARTGRGLSSPAPANPVLAPAGSSGWFEGSTGVATNRLGRYALFAATADGQPSFECTDAKGQAFGPLTLAVCRAWLDTPAPTTSYRAFYQAVRQHMSRLAPYQLPTLEGNADAPFLGR